MPHVFRLGVRPWELPAFNAANVNAAPEEPGVYIIYEPAGPFYVGRSGRNIRRRLQSHLRGTGNKNVKLATKIREVGSTLTFTYAVLPRASQAEIESVLIATLGTARLANMRREGLYEAQFYED